MLDFITKFHYQATLQLGKKHHQRHLHQYANCCELVLVLLQNCYNHLYQIFSSIVSCFSRIIGCIPRQVRARYGSDNTRNAAHGSDSAESAGRELEFFFPSGGKARQNTACFTDCTCCIIKPHALLAGMCARRYKIYREIDILLNESEACYKCSTKWN